MNYYRRRKYGEAVFLILMRIYICGNSIIPVVLVAEKYSGYDISEIKEQIEMRRVWYKDNCYDDYFRQFGDNDVDLFEVYGKRGMRYSFMPEKEGEDYV